MPLSSNGLCEALMTMPADSRNARVRYATARRRQRAGKIDIDAGGGEPASSAASSR